jgi:hypothetical protein
VSTENLSADVRRWGRFCGLLSVICYGKRNPLTKLGRTEFPKFLRFAQSDPALPRINIAQ